MLVLAAAHLVSLGGEVRDEVLQEERGDPLLPELLTHPWKVGRT